MPPNKADQLLELIYRIKPFDVYEFTYAISDMEDPDWHLNSYKFSSFFFVPMSVVFRMETMTNGFVGWPTYIFQGFDSELKIMFISIGESRMASFLYTTPKGKIDGGVVNVSKIQSL